MKVIPAQAGIQKSMVFSRLKKLDPRRREDDITINSFFKMNLAGSKTDQPYKTVHLTKRGATPLRDCLSEFDCYIPPLL